MMGNALVCGNGRIVILFSFYAITIPILQESCRTLIFAQKGDQTMQRYFGNGYKSAWVDCFESTETRKTRNFGGFTLHNGQVFGKDENGQFVLTNIVERSDSKSGVYATVLLYRRHKERGWILQWERSVATVNAIDMYMKHNRHCRITRESADGYVNPLQEVKGQKYFQPIF